MITIQREKWIDCIDELMPLCHAAFELEESKFTGLQLNFDVELFEHCEQLDSFHCLVMRKDGAAIGFHWIFITPMLRHKGMAQAHTDAIFVNPDYRNHSAKLLQFSEQHIKDRAQFWTLANLATNDRQAMWQRKGFQPIETIMFKKL